MADAKMCDICDNFFVPNNVDGTKLTGYVGSHDIDIRFNPGPHDDVDMNYNTTVDMCNNCIKRLLTDIIGKL